LDNLPNGKIVRGGLAADRIRDTFAEYFEVLLVHFLGSSPELSVA
jgi:hypothetical protein